MSEDIKVKKEGSGATDQGSLPSLAFSIKPQHTGNNLWTWPSNSPAPSLNPGIQPLTLHNYMKPTHSAPLTLWPAKHTPSWQDKPNVMHSEAYGCYICIHAGTNVHTLLKTRTGHQCSFWRVSAYSLALAQRLVIKKSNTVNARGHQHINI